MKALPQPLYKSDAKPRTSARFFDDQESAETYHCEMRDAGKKPRTTKVVSHKDCSGAKVYAYKVTTHA